MTDLQDFYSALVQFSDDAIVAKDTSSVVLAWNDAAERLFGWSAEEMVGHSIRRILPEDLQDEENEILARIRKGERIGQFFTRRRHKSGKELEVSVTVSPVRDATGAIIGASTIVRDAGPFLESQRLVRESERKFRMMADTISQLAWIADGDGNLFWYNRRWFEYTGTTLEEMQGWGWEKVHQAEMLPSVLEGWRAALAEGREWEDTFPLRRHDGEWRWFLTRAKPIRGDDGEVEFWFGTNTDITEQREQAEQIRLLLMEVNHRAKNLLGTVQALARRTAPQEADFLKRFEDRIRSLAINQDILVKREWRNVPVRELVAAQLAHIEQAAGEIAISGADLALLPRAGETIGMALHELSTNALKYGALSADGGHIEIGWRIEGAGADSMFRMWWQESGGPHVNHDGHKGFGTRLIVDVPQHNLGASVAYRFEPGGVRWEISCPLDRVARLERDVEQRGGKAPPGND